MPAGLYLYTSAVLRATLEAGTTPDLEDRIRVAAVLITSRLSLVEAARALLRARELLRLPAERLAEAQRDVEAIWARCEVWELTPSICEAACHVAPHRPLRALDALNAATFLAARRRVEGLELVTTDQRLRDALGA